MIKYADGRTKNKYAPSKDYTFKYFCGKENNQVKKKCMPKEKQSYIGVLFASVLLIQLLALVYIGIQRDGMHIDEYYSYILSNSYSVDRISNAPNVWNQWQNGNVFHKFISVEKGEQFAFLTVYENTAKDAHPPLYYFLLHTLCSLFPGSYSPWFGMGLNIFLTLLTQISLFRLGKKLMGDSLWAIIPVALYGGMQVFADTTLFIRMYALMTLLTILIVEQHYHLIMSKKKLPSILWCFVLTFLGTFTQYYFAIFAFFLAVSVCIFFIIRRHWKVLISYSVAMLLAILCVFLVFPAGITQITGSGTNNIGNEVTGNLLDFSGWGYALTSMVNQMLAGIFMGLKNCLPFACISTLITLVVAILFRPAKCEERKKENIKQSLYFIITLAFLLVVTMSAIAHISGKFTYVRYLYNLFPLVALLCVMILCLISGSIKLNKHITACGIIIVCLICTCTIAKNTLCSYMFTERSTEDNAIIEQCKDKPLIVLNNGSTYQPTALLHIFFNSNQMYMANYNTMTSIDFILEQIDCSNGVIFLVLTDVYWSDGFDGDVVMTQITDQSLTLECYRQFGACDFTTAYIAFPK